MGRCQEVEDSGEKGRRDKRTAKIRIKIWCIVNLLEENFIYLKIDKIEYERGEEEGGGA